jgi:hypothetical protein
LIETLVGLNGRLASVHGVTPAQQFRLHVIRQISGFGMVQSIIHGVNYAPFPVTRQSVAAMQTQEKLVDKPPQQGGNPSAPRCAAISGRRAVTSGFWDMGWRSERWPLE